MEPIIKVTNLSKQFNNIKAVDHLSFTVEPGDVFGFLGVRESFVISAGGTAYRREAALAEALERVAELPVFRPSSL